MEPVEALNASTSYFLSVLGQVREHQLTYATPCEDWDVAQLLGHVARGSDMAVALVKGATHAQAVAAFDSGATGGSDDDCRRALLEQRDALGAVADLGEIVHHPMGDIPVRQLFDFRVGDLTLHGWDLAKALGVDQTMPDVLVDHVYGALSPLEALIADIGVFGQGPSGTVGSDAPTQVKLLDLTGRRP